MTLYRIVWATIIAVAAGAGPAQSASTTTYVASTGQNKGACTRTAPCLSFAYAISQTPAGGEVVALDTSAYGPFTINKAITISSAGPGPAHIGNIKTGGTAILVSAGAGDVVRLRGLQIFGGATGIGVTAAASVDVTDVLISGTSNAALVSTGATNVRVADCSFANTSTGIAVQSGGSLLVKDVQISANGTGIDTSNATQILGSTIKQASTNGVFTRAGSTFIKQSLLTGNGTGLSVAVGATARIDTTTITGNTTGVANAGTLNSYGNNNIAGNTTDGTTTQVPLD